MTMRRYRRTRATALEHWAPKSLINATPETLARISRKKLLQVARYWRRRLFIRPDAIKERLRKVSEARRVLKERRLLVPPLKIAQRALRLSGLAPTEPEVIAMVRAICTPDEPPAPLASLDHVTKHAEKLREIASQAQKPVPTG